MRQCASAACSHGQDGPRRRWATSSKASRTSLVMSNETIGG